MNFESKRHDRASVRSSFSPQTLKQDLIVICVLHRVSDSYVPQACLQIVLGVERQEKKERFYLLFVAPVSCITDTPFSAVNTVIIMREKCKPFLLCLAGGKEKGWKTCCQLDASFLQR